MTDGKDPTPEFGTTKEDVAAFNEAMTKLDEHNSEFSLGKTMARMMTGIAEATTAPKPAKSDDEVVDYPELPNVTGALTAEEEMARSVLGITEASALEASGLKISPSRSVITAYTPGMDPLKIGKLYLQVEDAKKYARFLNNVPEEYIDAELMDHVLEITYGLVDEINNGVMDSGISDDILETLGNSQAILKAYDHIGQTDDHPFNTFKAYAEQFKEGTLLEYVLLENNQVLVGPESHAFGPSNWYFDADDDELKEKWDDVIAALTYSMKNPKARALFDEALANARKSLAATREGWAKLKASEERDPRYGEGFEVVFDQVERELDAITVSRLELDSE